MVTDNDGNAQRNCVDKYLNFSSDANIKICYEPDDIEAKSTFEKILYSVNQDLCDGIFGDVAQNYDSVQSYMLKNKTEAAYSLLAQTEAITVPDYIRGAIEWIKA
jgi:acyl-coenzyme A synthetase/AMP-(fatty) acid ligase